MPAHDQITQRTRCVCRGFQNHRDLDILLDRPFPAVDRRRWRKDVRAGRQAFGDCFGREGLGRFEAGPGSVEDHEVIHACRYPSC